MAGSHVFRFVALIYKGKRVFLHETNLNDTESARLPEGMKKKSVCVFMFIENGVAVSVYFSCVSVARSVHS